jgi:hypothetical protein
VETDVYFYVHPLFAASSNPAYAISSNNFLLSNITQRFSSYLLPRVAWHWADLLDRLACDGLALGFELITLRFSIFRAVNINDLKNNSVSYGNFTSKV